MTTQDDGCTARSGRLNHPLNSGVERLLVDAAFRTGEVSYRCISVFQKPKPAAIEHTAVKSLTRGHHIPNTRLGVRNSGSLGKSRYLRRAKTSKRSDCPVRQAMATPWSI
jgi:hypothetical protein